MTQSATRTLVTVAVILVGSIGTGRAGTEGEDGEQVSRAQLPLILYEDSGTETELPFAPSGWMGNTEALQFDDACTDSPRAGQTCIRVTYDAPVKWGGIAWQSPAEDWGDEPGGFDLTGAKKLTFWARGAKGGEMVEFKLGIYEKDKPYPDSGYGSAGKVKLSQEWRQYAINLSGQDLSRIKSGFVFAVQGRKNPVTFYIDDIRYE
jgi:hypothetical protein